MLDLLMDSYIDNGLVGLHARNLDEFANCPDGCVAVNDDDPCHHLCTLRSALLHIVVVVVGINLVGVAVVLAGDIAAKGLALAAN